MPYVSEGETIDVKYDKAGTVSFTSNCGDYVVQNKLNEGDVCVFKFEAKEGSLMVMVHTI